MPAEIAHFRGQLVDLAAVLAGERAQVEQARLDLVERGGIEHERLARGGELVLRLPRLDHRAIKRGECLGEQRMLGRDPVEPPGSGAQVGERRVRTVPQMAQFLEVAGQLLALLHRAAGFGEPILLAFLGRQRGQLGEVGKQQVLVGLRLLDRPARLVQLRQRRAPLRPCGGDACHVRAGVAVEQRAVAARVDQAAIVVLAVQLDQRAADFPQERDADRLVVDPRARAAVRLHRAPQDQRLAGFDEDVGFGKRSVHRFGQRREFEGCGDARLVLARAHQPGIRAIAQHQAERIEQDRLARPGLAGEHAKARAERKFQPFDQHHVPDGKRSQHRSAAGLAQRLLRVTGQPPIAHSHRARNRLRLIRKTS